MTSDIDQNTDSATDSVPRGTSDFRLAEVASSETLGPPPAGTCTTCKIHPRLRNTSYCRGCRNAYQRAWRRRGRPQLDIPVRELTRPDGVTIRIRLHVDGPLTPVIEQHVRQLAAQLQEAGR
jgi:hypothetical protein